MPQKPLEGVKVLDLTSAIAGPKAIKTLSDWGAEVIRIESRTKPEPARIMGPYRDGIRGLDRSAGFNQRNTGKRCVSIDLSQPKGVEIAKRLVAWADVLTENFAGGAIDRMGLGYEELRKVKPDIIMLSSSALGHTGPGSTHPGYAGPLNALAGFNYISGWPDRGGADIGVYSDYIAAHCNVIAILAALDYRRQTGKGQYIDGSQYENSVHFIAPLLLDYVVNQRVAGQTGNQCSYAAPHNAYRCHGEDRWCALAVFTDEEWQSFRQVIGNPAWSKEPRFSTLLARKQNEAELDRQVEEWTINHSAEEVMSLMQAAGVAAGVLQTSQDLMEHDPQLEHLHFFQEVDHPEAGKERCLPPSSFLLSKSAYEVRPAPLMGGDNDYVLKEILGLSDDEIAEMVIAEVIK